VCDLTRQETLKELDNWIQAVERVTGDLPMAILGNKVDLTDELAVTEQELAKASAQYDAPFYLTSAKTGANVEKTFTGLATTLVQKQGEA
jgi:GTPase SAR1 family protein